MKISKKYILEQIEAFNKQDNVHNLQDIEFDVDIATCIIECLLKASFHPSANYRYRTIEQIWEYVSRKLHVRIISYREFRERINKIRRNWHKIAEFNSPVLDKLLRTHRSPDIAEWFQKDNFIGETYIIANSRGYMLCWGLQRFKSYAFYENAQKYKDKIQRSKRSKMVEELQLMLMGIE
jgi:hypothetical protein